jgi:hypothetical protein
MFHSTEEPEIHPEPAQKRWSKIPIEEPKAGLAGIGPQPANDARDERAGSDSII